MVKTILCTVDLSGSSRQTVAWAVTMAQQLHGHLTILYTYRLMPARSGEIFQLKQQIEEEAQQKFLAIEKELLLEKGISYDFRTEVGFISDRIDDHARKNNLNFLVMDRTVSANANENFIDLIEHIHVPMLLIP